MSKYSPKKSAVYSVNSGDIGIDIKCSLVLKWDLKDMTEDKVTLSHRNIILTLNRQDFESDWKKVENNERIQLSEEIRGLYKKGLTEVEIAKKLGISQSTVNNYKNYKKTEGKDLDVDMLVNLADSGWTLKELRTEAEFQTKRSYTNDEIIKILAERGYGLAE